MPPLVTKAGKAFNSSVSFGFELPTSYPADTQEFIDKGIREEAGFITSLQFVYNPNPTHLHI